MSDWRWYLDEVSTGSGSDLVLLMTSDDEGDQVATAPCTDPLQVRTPIRNWKLAIGNQL